jgi:hypothetical protein
MCKNAEYLCNLWFCFLISSKLFILKKLGAMCAFVGLPGCPEPGGSGRARTCRAEERMRKTRPLRPAPTADHSNPAKVSRNLCIQEVRYLPKSMLLL